MEQHINVGIPDGVGNDAPVLFGIAGEEALEKYPWSPIGLEVPPESDRIDQQEGYSEYATSYGRHFHLPEGFHGPARQGPGLQHTVWATAFELAGVELPE